jgi:hypothetical protein
MPHEKSGVYEEIARVVCDRPFVAVVSVRAKISNLSYRLRPARPIAGVHEKMYDVIGAELAPNHGLDKKAKVFVSH